MGNNVVAGKPNSKEEYMRLREALDKAWADCSVEEKLDKVREELMQLGYNTAAIRNVETEVAKLKEHSHDLQGKVVIAINSNAINFHSSGAALAQRRNNLS